MESPASTIRHIRRCAQRLYYLSVLFQNIGTWREFKTRISYIVHFQPLIVFQIVFAIGSVVAIVVAILRIDMNVEQRMRLFRQLKGTPTPLLKSHDTLVAAGTDNIGGVLASVAETHLVQDAVFGNITMRIVIDTDIKICVAWQTGLFLTTREHKTTQCNDAHRQNRFFKIHDMIEFGISKCNSD